MKMQLFRSTAAATIAVAAFISCYSAHASMRSAAPMPWGLLQAQLDAGGVVTLTGDVTAIDGDTTLTVTNAVTLDLNGHTIDAAGLFGAISVAAGGDLTLTNSLAIGAVTGGARRGVYVGGNAVFRLQGGAIAGNIISDYGGGGVFVDCFGAFEMSGGSITNNAVQGESFAGGGVFVAGDGRFTMNGGEISGNTASYGGGVYVEEDGTFTMTGGEISGNMASNDGGGVEMNGGTFTMSGGEISGNTASLRGGGVDMYWGSFTLTGGAISGNASDYGGGVFVFDTFTVSGSPIVSDNTNSVGATNNVYLYWATITVDGLSAGAHIGVKTETAPTLSNPVTFATDALADDVGHFFSDNPAFAVDAANDELRLRKLPTPWDMLQAQLDEGGTVTLTNDVTAADGDAMLTVTNAVTLDLNGHTIAFNGSKEVFHVGTGGDLTLTNGLAAGAVTGGGDHGVYIGSNAVFRLQGGAIAGNTSGYGGGGVFVNAFGTFEMSGGSVTNNAVYDGDNAGGGVYVVKDGTFTMSGGTISGNAALWAGGVDVRGTFAMSGGEISSNTARAGGGVRVDWSGAFTISGGEISSNTATNYGGGVLVDMSESFTVSGSAFVSGNARPDGSANNVYIYWTTITVSNLTANASIGVTTGTEPTASEPVTFATGASADDAARFTSDNPAFAVDAVNGELRLIKRTTAWDRLQAQLDAGGIVTLTNDVTATSVDWTLTVTNAVTLDLNGHVIDAAGYFGVIQIFDGGNLTLTNGTESAGTITGGATDLGGGVEVYGTFTMAGGEISANTASVGGGVGVGWGGAFTMSGGTISDNSANWAGGVEAYGTFTMSGGTISGNVADDGGGVYVDGTFTVSGSPVVHGNTNSVGTANNVYLPNGCSIAVDGLSADASIGVTTEDAPAVYSPIAFATGAAAGDETRFFGDDPALVVDNADGELRLRPLMTWGLLQALLDAGGTVTLTDDMVATNGNASLSVTNAVILDLNGHSITHNGNGCVINVRSGGDLTLTNSLAAGVVTGGSGGVYIYDGGTFTMTGGTISGNTTKDGGGVFVDSHAAFTMSGGEISGNRASKYGGGVYVRFYSSFTMSGGTISGNSASRSGGGVYVCEDVTFTMSGGEITGNAAPEGGGASMYCRSIAISGSPVVFGNTNSFGSANNVYLWARTFHSSGLSAGTRIGVNTYDTPTLSSRVTIASGTSADDGAYFFSDNPAFAVSATTGVMYLVRIPTAWDLLQAQLNEGGTVTLASNVTATARDATLKVSNAVTLDLNGHTIDAAGHFGVIEVCAGGDLTLTNSVEGAGAITGGGNAYEGAGVEVRAGGAFTMTGGAISGNSSTYASGVDVNGTFTMTGGTISNNTTTEAGGGVYVYDGTFTMSGGSITGNTASRDVGNAPAAATRDGGGVYIYGDGTFTMTGGTISGNMADSGGGGVYVCWGYFTMTGGTISGNTAGDEGGGVYMSDGTFTVSGSPVVSDNTNSVGEAKNVYLKDWFLGNGYAIAVSNLTAGAHIGVKTETAPTLSNPVTFATDASAGDAAYFFSDVFGYDVEQDGGNLQLVPIMAFPTYLNGADNSVRSKYVSWAARNGEDLNSEHEAAFLLNVAPSATPTELRIDDIEVGSTGATIRVAATAGGASVDMSQINGVLVVATGDAPASLKPKAIPAADVSYAADAATIFVPSSAGAFIQARILPATPTTSLTPAP